MPSPLSAAGAYANMARIAADPSALAGIGNTQKSDTSFASVLKDAIGAVQETGQKSDVQTQNMIKGSNSSSMVDVVTAVSETEVAIDAVVAVRDKVISAYEEIMRMPI